MAVLGFRRWRPKKSQSCARTGRTSEPRPLILMHSGFDGSAEEMHVMGARAPIYDWLDEVPSVLMPESQA